MKTQETLLENLLETVQIDNLDLQYFIENSGATTFEELEEYIRDNNGFDVEIIYYADAIRELRECNIICFKARSIYWVNPMYIFNGNRIEYYKNLNKDNLVVKSVLK